MKLYLPLFALILGLGLIGCEDDPEKGDGINSGAKLAKLEGKLTFLGGNSNAKVAVLVGKDKVKGNFDPRTKKFSFTGLPAGPKTLVVEKDGKTYGVKFPKSNTASQQSKQTAILPDSNLTSPDGTLDLGSLTLGQVDGTQVFLPEHNPLAQVDTDLDGLTDFIDDDIDGDGTLNWDDDAPWGDEWSDGDEWMDDYGWEDEGEAYWDEDGDGEMDWDDADSGEWVDEDWDEYEEWDAGFEDDADLEAYCAEFADDEICDILDGDAGFDDYCAEYGADDPSCWGGDDYCLENPDDPICAMDCDPIENPEDCDWE